MLQDATNQQLAAINDLFPLTGATVVEIGCGNGRVTRDLAKLAKTVCACDPDSQVLQIARSSLTAANISFIHAPQGIPDLPDSSVDLVIYTLSLHHVPIPEMQDSLQKAALLVNHAGAIMVLEPGDGGSFTEAKSRFGAGSGDERPLAAAALQSIKKLPGWSVRRTQHFITEFLFADQADFVASKLRNFSELPIATQQKINLFLEEHQTDRGIVLTAERSLYLLRRSHEE